ncbi:MAG: c-type cytochrome [Polaromonas sp.]
MKIKATLLFGSTLLACSALFAVDAPVAYPKTQMSGLQVFQNACVACHGAGLAGAPRMGDKTVWSGLVAEGHTDLWGGALTGVRRMPPMGGDPALTDMEVALAVNYMVELVGGKFPAPTAASLKAARLDGEKRLKERNAKARDARK